MKKKELCNFSELKDREPKYALVENIDLVIVRYDDKVSVLYGRCKHRGALMADGHIDGKNIICGVHGWDYRYDTGVSEYNNAEVLEKFTAFINDDKVYVDADEIRDFAEKNPQPFARNEYLGQYADTHPEATEPYGGYIKELAKNGLRNVGHHGFTEAMGVDRNTLPKWEDIQFLPAQLASRPLFDEEKVNTNVVVGPKAKKSLSLDIPIFVSDMSFGALSRETKIALSKGAEMAGTGIASGEGGMLPEEQENNSRYFYELASGKFGFSMDKVKKAQAFHFKGGQGAKTGTGGHLPGDKVTKEIADVRGLKEGQAAISPAAFPDLITTKDFADFANTVREQTGGIPIGFKIAASHIEKDIDFAKALMLGADAIAVSNSALQAVGCLGMRACHTNNCPVGIATQKESLRQRIVIEQSAKQLYNFLLASNDLIKVIARACGHDHISKFNFEDLSTFNYEMHKLSGIEYAGIK